MPSWLDHSSESGQYADYTIVIEHTPEQGIVHRFVAIMAENRTLEAVRYHSRRNTAEVAECFTGRRHEGLLFLVRSGQGTKARTGPQDVKVYLFSVDSRISVINPCQDCTGNQEILPEQRFY